MNHKEVKKMKIVIRRNVFETNSSSMHSVVISKNTGYFTEEEMIDSFYCSPDIAVHYGAYNKGKIKADFTSHGNYEERDPLVFDRCPFNVLYSFADKLRFYIADHSWTDESMAQFIADLKKDFPFITSIKFGKNKYKREATEPKYWYGYVDHQSSGVLKRFLEKHQISVKEFLSNKQYIVIQDGDEYGISTDLFDLGLLNLDDNYVHSPYDGLMDKNDVPKEDMDV